MGTGKPRAPPPCAAAAYQKLLHCVPFGTGAARTLQPCKGSAAEDSPTIAEREENAPEKRWSEAAKQSTESTSGPR